MYIFPEDKCLSTEWKDTYILERVSLDDYRKEF